VRGFRSARSNYRQGARAFRSIHVNVLNGLLAGIRLCRENDVVLQLPFPGRAYIRLSDLKTQPPRRYEAGQRVRTPFGKGVVRAFRYRPETVAGCDYVVDLVENRMSGWTAAEPKVAVGYMNAADVQLRSEADRTADECIADSDVLREKGNAAFKVRSRVLQWAATMCAGMLCCAVLPGAISVMTAAERERQAGHLSLCRAASRAKTGRCLRAEEGHNGGVGVVLAAWSPREYGMLRVVHSSCPMSLLRSATRGGPRAAMAEAHAPACWAALQCLRCRQMSLRVADRPSFEL
jgi:hypothetical protein